MRFELSAYALNPEIRVIAPWREWDLTSRERLIQYAELHGIPVEKKEDGSAPYSIDANLLHISHEGGCLEDPLGCAGRGGLGLDRFADGGAR